MSLLQSYLQHRLEGVQRLHVPETPAGFELTYSPEYRRVGVVAIVVYAFLLASVFLVVAWVKPDPFLLSAVALGTGLLTWLLSGSLMEPWERIRVDALGVHCIPIRGQPQSLRWDEVESVQFVPGIGGGLVGSGRGIHVAHLRDGLASLKRQILERCSLGVWRGDSRRAMPGAYGLRQTKQPSVKRRESERLRLQAKAPKARQRARDRF